MSAYLSGYLIEKYGVPFVFGLTAVFPLMTLGSAILIQEKRAPKRRIASPRSADGTNGTGTGLVPAQLSEQVRPERSKLPAARAY